MQEVVVLYVEDSDAFAYLLNAAREEAGLLIRNYRVSDGEEALAFLRRHPPFEAAPVPELVFLDLNLPKKGGFEVLEELRSEERFRHLPVIVLSSSLDPAVRRRSLELGANEYIAKPFDFTALVRTVIGALARYSKRAGSPA